MCIRAQYNRTQELTERERKQVGEGTATAHLLMKTASAWLQAGADEGPDTLIDEIG